MDATNGDLTATGHSIFVTAYFGDVDTFNETHIIGPYPTAADRDRNLFRLAGLPGNNGDATFTPTDSDPASADHTCTPDKVATIKHFNQVVGALYGYAVGDDGEEVKQVGEPVGQDMLPGLTGGGR